MRWLGIARPETARAFPDLSGSAREVSPLAPNYLGILCSILLSYADIICPMIRLFPDMKQAANNKPLFTRLQTGGRKPMRRVAPSRLFGFRVYKEVKKV